MTKFSFFILKSRWFISGYSVDLIIRVGADGIEIFPSIIIRDSLL